MGADDAPVGRLHFARARGQVTRQELAEVALADEADTGGILLPRGRQAGFGGHAAHVGLGQIAKREHGGRELCLSQLVQEVALVLRSEENTSELQSLMRISYAVF